MPSTLAGPVEVMRILRDASLTQPWRSKAFLKWVTQNGDSCVKCGIHGHLEPHHFLGSSGPLKSSDMCVVPLCRECHTRVQSLPLGNWEVIELLRPWVRLLNRYMREK